MEDYCKICNRYKDMTFHHYIPRTLHSKKYYKKRYEKNYLKTHGVYLCTLCHKTIHRFFTERELGLYYNDMKKIISNERMVNYIRWIKKQK